MRCVQAIDAAVNLEESPLLADVVVPCNGAGQAPPTLADGGASAAAAAAPQPTAEQTAALHQLQHHRGVILVNVAKLRATAARVYALSTRSLTGAGDTATWAAEWQNLEADLLGIASAEGAARQARIAGRMHRTYLVFRA